MQKSLLPDRFRILSGSTLKLIAVFSMLLDHAALILAPVLPFLKLPLIGTGWSLYFILRKVGRISFPLFCFLTSEGLSHTRNRVRYLGQLLLFALLSEVPYDLMVCKSFFSMERQNIFFTLLFGGLLITVYDSTLSHLKKAGLMLFVLLLSNALKVDYGLSGVALIFLLYLLRDKPAAQAILSYPLLSGGIAAFAAFVPIQLYNGQRGFIRGKIMKYFFYVFYPAHILILLLIRSLL